MAETSIETHVPAAFATTRPRVAASLQSCSALLPFPSRSAASTGGLASPSLLGLLSASELFDETLSGVASVRNEGDSWVVGSECGRS
jgi:hypothetical protein